MYMPPAECETAPLTEGEARIHVALVRAFYSDLVVYGVMTTAFVFIWFLMSSSWSFWPGWVILGWGSKMLFQAWRLGLLNGTSAHLYTCLPFLNPAWEERQIKALMHEPLQDTERTDG